MTTKKTCFYGILALVGLLGLAITQSARANFIETITQVGTDVVVTGSGTIDFTDLTLSSTIGAGASIVPNAGIVVIGPVATVNIWTGISGPASFGSGGLTNANNSTGDTVGIRNGANHDLGLAQSYLSGSPLSGTATFNSATFASLMIDPGTYTWTWGTGAHADSFTIQIGPASVPDAGSTLPLLSFASLGLVALRRKLRC
jgi:VPDSG-CTERM motif